MNKIKKCICLCLMIALVNPIFSIKASEIDESEVLMNTLFEGLEETDKVLELSDGGFLYGKAKDVDAEDETIVYASYNSETDQNSITVKEAVEIIQNDECIQTRGAGLPSQTRLLAAGAVYTSNTFSGSGWRFGGYYFKSGGNGDWLKWSTFNDDGRVGDIGDATSVKNNAGSSRGMNLYVGYPQYLNTANGGLVYFTYNPKSGTYYRVENN